MRRLTFIVLALCAFAASAQAELVLREDTASQAVVLGPFVDSTDGNTAETALTISAADVRISVNGGNIVGKNSGDCTHDELGYYACTFDATDTATVGRLQVVVHESGALPVYHEFSVVEEAIYDACCAASAAPLTAAAVVNEWETQSQADPTGFHVNVLEVGGTAQTANDNGADINAILVDTSTTLDGALSTVDTVVDAIKLKTDQLTFTVTGQVDANAESMNAVEILGSGTTASPWNGE